MSLTYLGLGLDDARLCFRNVPNLDDLSLGGSYLIDRFHQPPVALSQIEKLKLCLDTEMFPEFREFLERKNVKELELISDAFDDQNLLSCASLLEACPNLYRLKMQFAWMLNPEGQEVVQQREKCSMHKCLKAVELVWFHGRKTEVELYTYILSTAPFLEKISIKTLEKISMEENVYTKKCARRLAEQLSPAAELVIL